MANLVITSTATTIAVDFGAYSTPVGATKGTFAKSRMLSVSLYEGGSYIHFRLDSGREFRVSYAANSYNALIVDSVDGVAPVSDAALYAQIVALFP